MHGVGKGLTVMQAEANPSAIAKHSSINSDVLSLHIYLVLENISSSPYQSSNYVAWRGSNSNLLISHHSHTGSSWKGNGADSQFPRPQSEKSEPARVREESKHCGFLLLLTSKSFPPYWKYSNIQFKYQGKTGRQDHTLFQLSDAILTWS